IRNECCPMCPAGSRVKTDCSEFRLTSCLPCIDGTFMNRFTGLKECLPCISCDEGRFVKTSCTTTSDAVCEPLDGFYCIDPIGNNCVAARKHRICHPGQYINQTGTAFTDTVCSDCSNGTFSDGTFTSCQPHTQCESINLELIKAGTASTDAECGEKSSNVTVAVICLSLTEGYQQFCPCVYVECDIFRH
uniref:TNFR-Cys domain-containing protein n=1 Tax=Amphiprion ocellaris TaxID=80972 RepID=A0A3Q1C9U0_AMPOC